MRAPSIDDLRSDEGFQAAYARLNHRRQMSVDSALEKAASSMSRFAKRCEVVLWDGLLVEDAKAFDTTIRTQLALGVYRATFAHVYTRANQPITEAIDAAVSLTDNHAANQVLERFARQSELLVGLDAAQPAAFHQLLDKLSRTRGLGALHLGVVTTDAALAVDVAIDAFSENAEMLDGQLLAIREGAGGELRRHAKAKDIPICEAAALWVLAMRSRCSLFGDDDRTVAYTDHNDESGYL